MNFSSAFASPLSLYSDIKSEFSPAISNEEFNLFHSIDRNVYSLLVQVLGKIPVVSLQVMGFWLFIEHELKTSGLMNTLMSWPVYAVNEVFNESLICLRHMHNDSLKIEKSDDEELFFLTRLLNMSVFKMSFFTNRLFVLSRVEFHAHKISRACQNIPVNQFRQERMSPHLGVSHENGFTTLRNGTRVFIPRRTSSLEYPKNGTGVFVPTIPTSEASPSNSSPIPPQSIQSQVVGELNKEHQGPEYFCASKGKIVYPNKFSSQNYFSMNKDSGEMVEEKQVEEVMAVDRTIFLTFSRGYPLTETDVRDFFTRRFGDFIESIEMQEVEKGEQPLFAKIVSKSLEMVDVVVEGGKAKYYINKKHVCARKFVLA